MSLQQWTIRHHRHSGFLENPGMGRQSISLTMTSDGDRWPAEFAGWRLHHTQHARFSPLPTPSALALRRRQRVGRLPTAGGRPQQRRRGTPSPAQAPPGQALRRYGSRFGAGAPVGRNDASGGAAARGPTAPIVLLPRQPASPVADVSRRAIPTWASCYPARRSTTCCSRPSTSRSSPPAAMSPTSPSAPTSGMP